VVKVKYLLVSEELAEDLVAAGAGRRRPKPRGTIIELVTGTAQVAAVCISLLQAPETLTNIALAFHAFAERRRAKTGSGKVEVRYKGPGGEIHLFDVDEETPIVELAKLVKRGLLD
jgi:hypothetical protein